jgi:voltage-gated potassium channel
MTGLAIVMVPILVLPLVANLSPTEAEALDAADALIWAVFAAEYGAKLYLAPDRWRFARTHLLDLVIVVIPLLRPLRILRASRALRLLRLSRLLAFVLVGLRRARLILMERGLNYVLLVVVVIVFAAAGVEATLERTAPGSNIHSYGDALWWAIVTITTVGYGDRFPVTAGGRGVAILLMVTGIALFGVLAASLSSYFMGQKQEDLGERLTDVSNRLERIERLLTRLGNSAQNTQADGAEVCAALDNEVGADRVEESLQRQ